MNRQLLRWVVCAFVFIAFAAVEMMYAQNPVTFRVRMSIKMREGTFQPGSGDIVRVAGSFNDWGNSTDTLRDVAPIDSIYQKDVSIAAGAISYKYLKTLRGGLDWEADPNRTYTVTVGTQAVPLVWFDNDSVFTPAVNAPVTFRVNMRVKMLEGSFQPGSGDIVRVAGSFNDWGNSTDTLRDVAPTDSIYQKTIQILENTSIQYKFLKTPRGGSDWEGDPNRTYTVPAGGGTLPVVYFDRDSIVNSPVSGTFRWTVDMSAFLPSATGLGWFSPTSLDTMEVRGSFNGWGGSPRAVLQRDPLTTATYFTTSAFNQFSGDVVSFKYFIDMDSASAVTRFPNYSNDQDGHRYEHPFPRGDGNQQYTLVTGGNISPTPGWYFCGISPRGVLDAVTDTVDVTLRVNMGPAKRGVPPFVAGDTVRLVIQDPISVSAQRRIQGATFTNVVRATLSAGGGDSIYQATYRIIGKAHYGLMYGWRFTKAGGAGEVTEGAGLGAQGGYRVRYATPTTPNNFVRNYTGGLDTWQGTVVPLPQETAPYATDVNDDKNGVPVEYSLNQNYPNPFNPATTIKFSLSKQSFVTLKVYNLIGQEVETLVSGLQPAGESVAIFDASKHATGVYFYRLNAGSFSETRKMLLLK